MAAAPRSTESRSVCVIVNPAAGGGRGDGAAEGLRELFAKHGARIDVAMARASDDVKAIARRAVERGDALLVVAGGDGTLAAAASVLSGTPTALGIIPIGTFNHFAKDVGIPMDPSAAAQAALGGGRRAVDVGEVNGQVFLNNSSLGIYPDMVRERTRQQTRLGRGRRWATVWAVIAALRRFPFLELRLEIDAQRHDCRAPFVFVGNNAYSMSAFDIGKRARLDEGLLSIYTSPRSTRPALVALALRALFGRLRQAKDFATTSARSLRVESRHRQLLVATDGEIAHMATPLEFTVRPRALQVAVPREG